MKPLKILSPLHKAIRQIEIFLDRKTSQHNLSCSEGHMVSYLLSYSPCPLADLNRILNLKPSTLTSMLDRLEKRKIITRKIYPDDRRSWIIELQPEGKKLAKEIRSTLESFEQSIIQQLSEEELEAFEKVTSIISSVTKIRVVERKSTTGHQSA
jgi:DNA-binding MarR family transcriptional regulator